MTIFRSAIALTMVNLLLRFAGTSFQVYLSGRIGAAGIGLLQLTMSVGSLAISEISPKAINCARALPVAVASTGPA